MKLGARLAVLALAVLLLVSCGQEDRRDAYIERGLQRVAEGDLTKARLEFKNALQIDPKSAEAWFQLAEVNAAQENWRAAFGEYAKVVELDPHDARARIKHGQLLFDAGEHEAALADAKALLSASPNDPDGLALRGAVRERQGDRSGANADAKAALDADGTHRNASLLMAAILQAEEDLNGARKVLEGALELHPGDDQLQLVLAAIYQKSGNPQAATKQLRALVTDHPERMEYVARLAAFLTQQGDDAAAEHSLREAVAANPEQIDYQLLLADWLAQKRGYEASRAELEKFTVADPERDELRFAIARLDRRFKKYAAAEAVYREIIRRDKLGPQGLKARTALAAMLLSGEGTSVDQAKALVEEVLEEDPRDIDALMLRAGIALTARDADQAIADLRAVIQNRPDATAPLRLLAKAHLLRDETTLAQDVLEKAIEVAPQESRAYLDLAQLRAQIGDMQGATGILEQFLANAPNDSLVHAALAKLQLSQQDWQAMSKTAEKILAAHPEHPLGHYLKGLVLQQKGDLQGSIQAFQTALDKRPGATELVIALARSYIESQLPKQAEMELKRFLAEHPNNPTALSLLGETYAEMERKDLARQQFERIVDLYPRAPHGYVRLAALDEEAGNYKAAVALLRKGLISTENNSSLQFRLGVLLQNAGDDDGAIMAYEQVLKREPSATVAINNLAMLLANRAERSSSDIERALELTESYENSDQWVLQDTRGWVQYRAGNYTQALLTLKEAASKVDPLPPEVKFHLGAAEMKAGDAQVGKKLIERAVDESTDFPGRSEALLLLARRG